MSEQAEPNEPVALKDFKPPELQVDKDGLPVVPENPFGELDKIRDQLPESREETPATPEVPDTPSPEPAGTELPEPQPPLSDKAEPEASPLDDLLKPLDTPDAADDVVSELEKNAPEDRKQANKWYRKAISSLQEKHAAEIENSKSEVQKMREELESERAKLEARRQEYEQQEREYAAAVPESHPEIKAIQEGLQSKWADTMKSLAMTADDPSKVQMIAGSLDQLTNAYDQLDPADPNFAQTRDAIRDRVDEVAGHGTFDKISPFLKEASDTQKLIATKTQELQGSATEAVFQREKRHWDEIHQRVSGLAESWGKVPDDIQETNPFSPDAIIQTFAKEVPEFAERLEKLKEQLPEFHTPLPPVDPAEVASMSDEDKATYLAERQRRKDQQIDAVIQRSYKHFALEMVTPLLAKRLKDQQDLIDSITANEPVATAGGAERHSESPSAEGKELTVREAADELSSPEAFEKYMADKGFSTAENSRFGLR